MAHRKWKTRPSRSRLGNEKKRAPSGALLISVVSKIGLFEHGLEKLKIHTVVESRLFDFAQGRLLRTKRAKMGHPRLPIRLPDKFPSKDAHAFMNRMYQTRATTLYPRR